MQNGYPVGFMGLEPSAPSFEELDVAQDSHPVVPNLYQPIRGLKSETINTFSGGDENLRAILETMTEDDQPIFDGLTPGQIIQFINLGVTEKNEILSFIQSLPEKPQNILTIYLSEIKKLERGSCGLMFKNHQYTVSAQDLKKFFFFYYRHRKTIDQLDSFDFLEPNKDPHKSEYTGFLGVLDQDLLTQKMSLDFALACQTFLASRHRKNSDFQEILKSSKVHLSLKSSHLLPALNIFFKNRGEKRFKNYLQNPQGLMVGADAQLRDQNASIFAASFLMALFLSAGVCPIVFLSIMSQKGYYPDGHSTLRHIITPGATSVVLIMAAVLLALFIYIMATAHLNRHRPKELVADEKRNEKQKIYDHLNHELKVREQILKQKTLASGLTCALGASLCVALPVYAYVLFPAYSSPYVLSTPRWEQVLQVHCGPGAGVSAAFFIGIFVVAFAVGALVAHARYASKRAEIQEAKNELSYYAGENKLALTPSP